MTKIFKTPRDLDFSGLFSSLNPLPLTLFLFPKSKNAERRRCLYHFVCREFRRFLFLTVIFSMSRTLYKLKTFERGLLSFWERNKVRGNAGEGKASAQNSEPPNVLSMPC